MPVGATLDNSHVGASEDTIAAAIGQLHQHQNRQQVDASPGASPAEYDPQQQERRFRETYGFDFARFSINPCAQPNLDPTIHELQHDPKAYAKFHNWLRLSPYGVWVTKIARAQPYAQCKYSHCQLRFKFDGHANTSNIIKHMRRRHKDDYELFNTLLGRPQRRSGVNGGVATASANSATNSVLAPSRKPFAMRKELVPLVQNKLPPAKQLNFFVDTLLPLSAAGAFSQFLSACNLNYADVVLSADEMVLKLDEYHHEFEEQLKQALSDTQDINVLVETWSSPSGEALLAVMASFCPNLALADQQPLKLQAVNARTGPGVHVLELINAAEVEQGVTFTVADILSSYGIPHKVKSITLKDDDQIILSKDALESNLKKRGLINQDFDFTEIKSLGHLLYEIIHVLVNNFRTQFETLASRVDRLVAKLHRNFYLRKAFRSLVASLTNQQNGDKSVQAYHQMRLLVQHQTLLHDFYNANVENSYTILYSDDRENFCYTTEEISAMALFVKVTAPLFGCLQSLQERDSNSLPRGIAYYLQINQYFQACDRILSGIYETRDVAAAGLEESDLSAVEEDVRNTVLGIISRCSSLFNLELQWAYAQPAYWAAYMLQPQCKAQGLEALDHEFRKQSIQLAYTFVESSLKSETAHSVISAEQSGQGSSFEPKRANKLTTAREQANMHIASEEELRNLSEKQLSSHSEWELYMGEPIEETVDFVKYWLRSQRRFPRLAKLALSLHNSRISTADAEAWFCMSKSALVDVMSQRSMCLSQATTLRNRLLCFETGHSLAYVQSVAAEQWEADEARAIDSTNQNSGPEALLSSADEEIEPDLVGAGTDANEPTQEHLPTGLSP
ncbi:putative transposase of the Rover hAT-like DNA transposon [Lachancea quebecensis]|uniref:Putative transposase of the Rover hAT-like DNA transposon n=1 Tax=Lachancea quebecensis TaxID=1654605 RepID=A0A0P1KRJ0_9SACH|nr:putative transposase of the Rover hAT-like DNA transposon [Lachancea quebecensis]